MWEGQIEGREKMAQSGSGGQIDTSAERQALANQQVAHSATSLLVTLANDPDATGPLSREDAGWTVRLVKDAKTIGEKGTERLKEWGIPGEP